MDSSEPKSNENIRVFCRVRPFNDKENEMQTENVFNYESPSTISIENKRFVFDRIFPGETTQDIMFDSIANNINIDLINGINSAIFAYGQTSSGKTHTMQGVLGDINMEGIIPRLIRDLFDKIAEQPDKYEFTIHVSFYEIYNNEAYDLLSISDKKEKLDVMFSGGQPVIKKLQHAPIANMDQFFHWYEAGQNKRRVASTQMNAHSSRSHSILEILMSKKEINSIDNTVFDGSIYKSKVQLVDLAGSESVNKTGASGERLNEASNINKSLTTLGIVISELAKGKTPEEIIHFRSSRLTMVCRVSLGGNSRTTIIVCCSPSSYNRPETINTLRFGNNASHIKSVVSVNKELTLDELKRKYNIIIMNYNKVLTVKSEVVKWRNGQEVAAEDQIDLSRFVTQDRLGVVSSNKSVKRRKKTKSIIGSKSDHSLVRSKGYNSMVSVLEKKTIPEMTQNGSEIKSVLFCDNVPSSDNDGDQNSVITESITTSTYLNETGDSGLDMSPVDRSELERLYAQNSLLKKENFNLESDMDKLRSEIVEIKYKYDQEMSTNSEMLGTYEKINNEYEYKSRMLDELVEQYHVKAKELSDMCDKSEDIVAQRDSLEKKIKNDNMIFISRLNTFEKLNENYFEIVKNLLLENYELNPHIQSFYNLTTVESIDDKDINPPTKLDLLCELKDDTITQNNLDKYINAGMTFIRKIKNVIIHLIRDNDKIKEIKNDLLDDVEAYKLEISNSRHNYKKLTLENIDINEKIEQLKSQNDTLTEELRLKNIRINGILSPGVKDGSNADTNDLDYQIKKLENMRKDNEIKTGKISELTRKIVDIEDDHEKLKTNFTTISTQLKEKELSLHEFKKYFEYKSRINNNKRPYEEKKRVLLQRLLQTRQRFVNDIFKRISNNSFKDDPSNDQIQYENISGSIALIQKIKSDAELLDNLSKKNTLTIDENNKLRGDLTVQNQQVNDLQKRINDLEKRNKNLTNIFHNKTRELMSVKSKLGNKRKNKDLPTMTNINIPLRGGDRR